MNDEELFRLKLREDAELAAAAAPPPHFARLWHAVQAKKIAQLERRLSLATLVPALLTLIAGVASFAAQGGWHGALPCCAVAFWLGFQSVPGNYSWGKK